VQPRASSELIPGVLGTDPMLEDIGAILDDIGAILDDTGAILDDIEAIPDDIEPDDIGIMLDGIGVMLDGIGVMLDGIGVMLDGIGVMLDEIEDILDMDEVEVICIELSVVDIAIALMSADMLDPLMSILFLIPIVLVEEVSEDIGEDPLPPGDEVSSPRPVPALRMLSGRHSTRPNPFARRLSTQLGNAPVLV